jgi:hypothetical protein
MILAQGAFAAVVIDAAGALWRTEDGSILGGIMSALLDLWHSIVGIVTTGDWVTLAIMVVIALAVGFAMQNFGSIVTATFAALVVFGLATFARGAAGSKDALALAKTDWHSLLGLTVHSLLAYAVAFAVVIGIVSFVRSLVMR